MAMNKKFQIRLDDNTHRVIKGMGADTIRLLLKHIAEDKNIQESLVHILEKERKKLSEEINEYENKIKDAEEEIKELEERKEAIKREVDLQWQVIQNN